MPPPNTQPPAMVPAPPAPKKQLSMSLYPRIIIAVLLVVIGVMAYLWKPWDLSPKATDRTVSVTGQATVKAEPDEYVFYPSYEFKNADKAVALAEMTKKSDELVAAIKKLGVPDSAIKTNASGYGQGIYYPVIDEGSTTYTLSLTITVANRELSQKVQDYLVTTSPSGAVSPLASFSEEKQNQLESQARDQATKDARAKADQSAKNLGFKITKVKSVDDGAGFGGIEPLLRGGAVSTDVAEASPRLTVQPGENELSYSVTVVYYIK